MLFKNPKLRFFFRAKSIPSMLKVFIVFFFITLLQASVTPGKLLTVSTASIAKYKMYGSSFLTNLAVSRTGFSF